MKRFNQEERNQAYEIICEWARTLQQEANKTEIICQEFEDVTSTCFSQSSDYLSNAYLLLAYNHLQEKIRDINILLSLFRLIKQQREDNALATEQNKTFKRFFKLKRFYQDKWEKRKSETDDLLTFLQTIP